MTVTTRMRSGGPRMRALRALTAGLLAYLFSATPAAASVIYCIGSDGHTGFEIVAGASTGCDDCCHRPVADDHGDLQHEECVDISMAGHAPTVAKKHDAPAAPLAIALFALPSGAPPVPPVRVLQDSASSALPPLLELRRAIVLQV